LVVEGGIVTLREATALVLLYHACGDEGTRRRALELVPDLGELVDMYNKERDNWQDVTCVGAAFQEQFRTSYSSAKLFRHRPIRWYHKSSGISHPFGWQTPGNTTTSLFEPTGEWLDGPSPDGLGKSYR
jgi:hypothetical protein